MEHRTGIVVHVHHVIGMGNLNALGQRIQAVLFKNLQNFLSTANQNNIHAVSLYRVQRAQYRSLRRVVAAHGVQNDLHMYTSFFKCPLPSGRRSPTGLAGKWQGSFPLFSEFAAPEER